MPDPVTPAVARGLADRLAAWCAATTPGDHPYRTNAEFEADVKAVVADRARVVAENADLKQMLRDQIAEGHKLLDQIKTHVQMREGK